MAANTPLNPTRADYAPHALIVAAGKASHPYIWLGIALLGGGLLVHSPHQSRRPCRCAYLS